MISPPIPRYTRASLRQVGVSSLTPLLVNRWWYTWQVDRLDETLGPRVDTHTHTRHHPVCPWAFFCAYGELGVSIVKNQEMKEFDIYMTYPNNSATRQSRVRCSHDERRNGESFY